MHSSRTSRTSPSLPCKSGKGLAAHLSRRDIRKQYICKLHPFLYLLLLSVPSYSDNLSRNIPAGAALVWGHASCSPSLCSHTIRRGSTHTLRRQDRGSCKG